MGSVAGGGLGPDGAGIRTRAGASFVKKFAAQIFWPRDRARDCLTSKKQGRAAGGRGNGLNFVSSRVLLSGIRELPRVPRSF